MKKIRTDIMGMPIIIETADTTAREVAIDKAFAYFEYVDAKFSTYKDDSEISRINKGLLQESDYSPDMQEILNLCEKTKQETSDYFDIRTPQGTLDPSGLVKGWAIHNAAKILKREGVTNFYIDAGGDAEVCGTHSGEPWKIGIRNPFGENKAEIVKVLSLTNVGIATSGTYLRGQHIYDPKKKHSIITEIVSMSVIGPNIYEADRFATAAFAMGRQGITFIENLPGFEGYMIDAKGIATMTGGFITKYVERIRITK